MTMDLPFIWAALIAFDLANQPDRATHLLGQCVLCHVQRFAPASQPIAK